MGNLRANWLALAFGLCASALVVACAGLPELRDDPVVESWKAEAARLRGLEFVAPVRFRWLRPEDTAAIIREELESAYEGGQARYRDAYAALGTLPPGIDLLETLLGLYEEQLLGLYSPRKRTMYVVADPGAGYAAPIVVHELVHALHHQHFGRTLAVAMQLRRNDDLVSALAAVMEGDASLTMLGVEGGGMRRDIPSAERVRALFQASLREPRGAMARVPLLLQVGLVFPYAEGTVFAARHYSNGGNQALDRALERPPLSTAAVTLPEYHAPVEFVSLPRRELSERLAARGCELGADNVAGAVTIDTLFEQYQGVAVREGVAERESVADREGVAGRGSVARTWRGDRFLQIDCGATWELVWLTRWSSRAAAQDFGTRYGSIAQQIAEQAPLSGTPTVMLDDRTALVLTPGLIDQADSLLEASEIRSYEDFDAWFSDACFPESPCPKVGSY